MDSYYDSSARPNTSPFISAFTSIQNTIFALMHQYFRYILKPLSLLYFVITKIRNILYDKGILKSNTFDTPLIVVGNLRVGGTGKTPQVAYLVLLLKEKYRIAVLSRGYKRKTSGFVLADTNASAERIGDEPFQLFRQHSDIKVAVDANRTHGINTLQHLTKPPEVIILDDAFQHRKVKAKLNILVTPYHDLYTNDTHLPSGNLRESSKGAERAQVIIVSKSPRNLTEKQQAETISILKPKPQQSVFFTRINYHSKVQNEKDSISLKKLKDYSIVLVTGIANPKPLLDFLTENEIKYKHLAYADHHNFNTTDIQNIKREYAMLVTKKKLILTTEKDYVRIFDRLNSLYFLGIQTEFINHQNDFDKLILDYVEQNSRNR
jgi:tetraacyldisaccharide 4'-kinase